MDKQHYRTLTQLKLVDVFKTLPQVVDHQIVRGNVDFQLIHFIG